MSESSRLAFYESRDGLEAAIKFAHTTLKVYRRAILHSKKRGHAKPHFASTPDYREKFIRSYVSFKAYLLNHKAPI